jgi:hypothetical protein
MEPSPPEEATGWVRHPVRRSDAREVTRVRNFTGIKGMETELRETIRKRKV